MIQGIKYVVIPTAEVDRSRALFEKVVGRPVAFQDGERWAEFKFAAGARLAIGSPDEAGGPGPGAVLVFESDDLEADVARLECDGLRRTTSRDMGSHGRIVAFESDCGPFQVFARVAPNGR